SDAIRVTGFVDDVRPYLDRAAVFVCPLRKGAGLKNKILQAWAMAKPVVATTISAGGLECKDGEDIVIRDRPADFAEAVVTLFEGRETAARLGEAGRRNVVGRYTWCATARELESVFRQTVRRPKTGAPGSIR